MTGAAVRGGEGVMWAVGLLGSGQSGLGLGGAAAQVRVREEKRG